MFNKKEDKYVTCHKCKHVLLRYNAQVVKAFYGEYSIYFCPADKVGYEKFMWTNLGQEFFNTMEVDENGIPKGYKKIGKK